MDAVQVKEWFFTVKGGPLRKGAKGAEDIIAFGQRVEVSHRRARPKSNCQSGKLRWVPRFVAAHEEPHFAPGKLVRQFVHPTRVARDRKEEFASAPLVIVP